MARSTGAVLAVTLASPVMFSPHEPLTTPSPQLGCTAVPRGPHATSAATPGGAALLLKKGNNYLSPAPSHLDKVVFQRDSLDPSALEASPAAWPAPPGRAPQHPESRGPGARAPARPRMAGSRAWPQETCSQSGCNESGSFLLARSHAVGKD